MGISGVEAAIRELEREQTKIRKVILMLKRIRPQSGDHKKGPGRKRLSAQARRRISEATKRRWAAVKASSKSRERGRRLRTQ
jgi:hypothetical protein